MKRLIKSSRMLSASQTSTSYTDHSVYARGPYKFSVYFNHADDPENFQCQVSEIHPYDMGKYYWMKKDQPASAKVIDSDGHVIGYLELREYDEDDYEDATEYINDIIDYMCVELRGYNRNVEPMIDKT